MNVLEPFANWMKRGRGWRRVVEVMRELISIRRDARPRVSSGWRAVVRRRPA